MRANVLAAAQGEAAGGRLLAVRAATPRWSLLELGRYCAAEGTSPGDSDI